MAKQTKKPKKLEVRLKDGTVIAPRTPTFGAAERLLAQANASLLAADLARDDGERTAHVVAAADQIWLGVRTAGQRILLCSGDSTWYRHRDFNKRVRTAEFERFKFTLIGKSLQAIEGGLHGGCAYGADDNACDLQDMRVQLADAIRDVAKAKTEWKKVKACKRAAED